MASSLPPDPGGTARGPTPASREPESWSLPGLSLQKLVEDDHFRIVPETMVDGLIVIDATGIIRYVNPGCERLFGYAASDLVGRNVSMLMPEPMASAHDGYLARHRATRVKRIIGIGRELTGLKSDGETFPMYLSVGEARADDDTIFVGIIYDLTEKKRAEETILHHQKLDAIGQLSGGIAHDFNNILSVISGNLEMIGQADLPPGARRAVARAQDAAIRAARITQRLLAFARKQPLRRQAIQVNAALEGLSDLLHRSLGETIELRMHLTPESGEIDTDIDQFETAILNLALNARDAMPSGGVLSIEVEKVRFDDDPRSAQEAPAGDYLCISVSDTGHGMSADVLARAIEPFFTTKDVGAGTGLGLSMVYGFMKQSGGVARLYSEEGRGTRVSLFFPRPASTTGETRTDTKAAVPRGNGETILVVEDDPDVRQVTVSRLEGLGYTVRIASDAAAALEVLGRQPNIDLTLVDVVMPGEMDGHALADTIERQFPKVRLVLTSGYSPRMVAGGVRERPFVPKPSSRAQLAEIIHRVLRS